MCIKNFLQLNNSINNVYIKFYNLLTFNALIPFYFPFSVLLAFCFYLTNNSEINSLLVTVLVIFLVISIYRSGV